MSIALAVPSFLVGLSTTTRSSTSCPCVGLMIAPGTWCQDLDGVGYPFPTPATAPSASATQEATRRRCRGWTSTTLSTIAIRRNRKTSQSRHTRPRPASSKRRSSPSSGRCCRTARPQIAHPLPVLQATTMRRASPQASPPSVVRFTPRSVPPQSLARATRARGRRRRCCPGRTHHRPAARDPSPQTAHSLQDLFLVPIAMRAPIALPHGWRYSRTMAAAAAA